VWARARAVSFSRYNQVKHSESAAPRVRYEGGGFVDRSTPTRQEKRVARREERRAAQRAATLAMAASAPDSKKDPRFKFGDILALAAIPLAYAAMTSDNNLIVAICFAISGVIACLPVAWHGEIARKYRAAYCLLIVALCAGLIGIVKNENLKKELARNEGVLEPGNNFPPRNCKSTDTSLVALYIGPHTFFLKKFPQSILKIAGRDILSLDKKGDNIAIKTLNLFDDSGTAFATIDSTNEDNHFWVAPNVRKYRPDTHTLVVYDGNAQEALRITFLNEKAISITGVFRYARRPPAIFAPDFFQMGGVSGKGGACSQGAVFSDTAFNLG
jgi:hypothetical protein